MTIDYIPVLQILREVYETPRGTDRFRQYLSTALKEDWSDVELVPIIVANPMALEHVIEILGQLLKQEADSLAADSAHAAAAHFPALPGHFRASLTIADDLKGGWTNRYAVDHGVRRLGDPRAKRFWITGLLWSSEPASLDTAREAIVSSIYRTAYVIAHGPSLSIGDLFTQESFVLAATGSAGPTLDAEDLDYTREVLKPLLHLNDMPTAIGCLYGDAAAATLGFAPMGLSPNAGLALARHDGLARLAADDRPLADILRSWR